MSLIDAVVSRYGTVRNVAKLLDIPEQRIYKWRKRGVPEKYNPHLNRLLHQGVPQQ